MRELDHLTLRHCVGQLFVLGFQGTNPDSDTRERLDRIAPGGFVLSQRNIDTLDQLYGLTSSLLGSCPVPPLLAIEHEGGALDRLRRAIAPLPSLGDLADAGTRFVRSGARLLAAELKAAGLNTGLSPILDLGLPGSVCRPRSLAAGPGEVVRLARIQLEEFHRKRLLCCGSHFPGLGGASSDPHFVLPEVRRPRRDLLAEDVSPFRELTGELDMIRVSHAHYPTLGDVRPVPASLSTRVITGLLREQLGFEGVVMTDDLTLGAVSSRGLTPETFVQAFRAGNDLLLFGQTTPLVEEAFETLVGTASRDADVRRQVETSSGRILRLKRELDLAPRQNRPHMRSRLVGQIERLRKSIAPVERVQVR